MNHKPLFVSLLLASLNNFGYAANPASTDYVNKKVLELQQLLESQIAGLPGGVAAGGTIGQILAKASNANYDTQWINPPPTYTVGQTSQGGVVFWVDSTGQHGLVAAAADNSAGIRWGTTGADPLKTLTLARGNELFSGSTNTTLIIARQASEDDSANSAALLCASYNAQNYGDWYLPSQTELNLLWQNSNINGGPVGGFNVGNYWSSFEDATQPLTAWYQTFATGQQLNVNKDTLLNVRCIRAF
ncbi:DUF1566 domain-containing protein [uncultured Legionella sp.]|uniref:Lcl domain-containing protein n=1 Tax=uncultured Legionella sp. TaxID=210934 RepID=UPI00262AB94E|nr:DUF1566 domain-containing protein [uncultured Legionella sp.]